MTEQDIFKKANSYYKRYGKHSRDRKKKYLELCKKNKVNPHKYDKLVYELNYLRFKSRLELSGLSVYKYTKPHLLKYQKKESYKKYRRIYEYKYRNKHRIMTNYLSWKSITKPCPEQEIDYLLKRFLK